ncbi:MAG: 3-deoxy-D-manno-octulosonic acid transferase [Cytophagales bacterium]|nr:3-deoxy-D-manno-octulosonic acid transferase [Cytophagales bacterium]
MLILYRLSIWFYSFVINVLSPFHTKARKFAEGRKNWKNQLVIALEKNEEPIVWFHAASLGEFEQGRPVIEGLKKKRNDVKVLITFFSPSGYEIKKDYEFADWVFYLPIDSPRNARFFIDTINPIMAIFIKYEFWYYFLNTLKNRQIPILMVSCIFRENQLFFHWATGPFYQRVLKTFNHFFVQDEKSKMLIVSIVGDHVTVSGDTRFDRVLTIANEEKSIDLVREFKNGKRLMVLGSTWPSDMSYLLPLIRKYQSEMKFVIAPHNIDESALENIESQLHNTVRFSTSNEGVDESEILLVDNMGLLSTIYRYGDFAFIGGAFRGALHNTLEAAVYGIPICFGENENNIKFMEAIELVEAGGGFTFSLSEELLLKFGELYENEITYNQMAESAHKFVKSRSGATELVMSKILELLP